MEKISQNNRTFLAEVIEASGSIEDLFNSALASKQSIDAVPSPGTLLKIERSPKETVVLLDEDLFRLLEKKTEISIENQNLIDLTIQSKGTIESLFDFGLENETSIDTSPVPGTKFMVPASGGNDEIVNYYKDRGLKPATGILNTNTCIYAECGYVEKGYWE